MFLGTSAMESAILFENIGGMQELFGSYFLLETLHSSFTVKTSKKVVKSGCF